VDDRFQPTLSDSDAVAHERTITAERTPALTEIRVGDTIGGRYRILERLGEGASGVVFRAHDLVADHVVAIKVLGADALRGQSFQRVRRELHAALKVTHAGVVRIHDLVEFDGRLALSMEYIEGETLLDRLHRSPRLSAPDVIALTRDLSRALAAAHRAGVIHRDLKPANIMLRDSNGRAVITDFGVSRLAAALPGQYEPPDGRAVDPALTREGQIVGTPLYMAPEQLLGEEIGPAADVYALGLVIFEAATGTRPQAASSLVELVELRLDRPAPPLRTLRPDLPAWLCRIVDRSLAGEARARFASAVEVRTELDAALSESSEIEMAKLAHRARLRRIRRALIATLALIACSLPIRWWLAGRLPTRDRRLSITAKNLGAVDHAWLADAIARMARHEIAARERRFGVTDSEHANVALTIGIRPENEGVALTAELAPTGGRATVLTPVHAGSVSAALDQLLEEVGDRLGRGQRDRGPDARERHEMEQLGTRSFEAYRLYARALDEFFSAVTADLPACERKLEEALRFDPEWPHALALLAMVQGEGSPRLAGVLERARRDARRDRDSLGQRLIEATTLSTAGKRAEATRLLDELYKQSPEDILAGWQLLLQLDAQQRTSDAIAVAQRMHQARPDLQFGADLARLLRDAGRGGEVQPLEQAWLASAPESEQALVSEVSLDLDAKQIVQAERHVRDVLLLYGEAPQRLATLADVLILAGRYDEAAMVATKLLRGARIDRARGHRRIGDIAVLTGRFAAAYDAFEQAVEEGKPFGNDGEVVQSLEALRAIAPIIGQPMDVDKHSQRLEEVFRAFGAVGSAATVAFERSLANGRCPSLGDALVAVPDSAARKIARRDMLRAAASAGCGSCADVVRAGLSSEERSTRSLFEFGVCALRTGARTLAADAFERAGRLRPASIDAGGPIQSSVYAILGQYELARTLEASGDPLRARHTYEQFLARWGHTDRALPEVESARAAVVRLSASTQESEQAAQAALR
jgi:tetratricopeptide (TPR) repeat protein